MNIKIKYEKGDTVWFMKDNKVMSASISSVSIFWPWTIQNTIQYTANKITDSVSWLDFQHLHESTLFDTKKELLESL